MNKLFKKISNVVVQDVINLVLEANQQQTIKPITSTRKIFIFSGRFQPFHINHYNVYKNICNKFGTQNVFIATSDNTKSQNSPFGFQQKKKIMTTMFNIPENNIFMVRKPYNPQQILKKFNPQKTIYFAVVGEKDSERLKNGAYFIPPEDYKIDQKFFNPFQKNGYIYQIEMQTPAYEGHIINGSLIREIFSNDKYSTLDKQKIFNSLYGNFNQQIFRLFINKFGGTLNQNLIYAISKLPSLLKQGGSYGHIKQLYADHTLSFGQLKQIIKSTISGQNDNKITQVSLKVDGRNMSISYKNGRMIAAISDEQTRNNGANALSISNFQSTINNRQHYKKESKEAYIIPFKMLNNIFNTSNKSDLNFIFQQGRRWISLQLISVDAPMLIPYDRNMIQFHGIFQSGTDPDTRVLETGDMYDFVNSILNVANNKIEQYGKTYQLMIPQLITWPKPKKPLQQLYKYLQQIDELMSAHSLSDNDTIEKYLKLKWKNFIVKTFGKITPQMLKEYLISATKENSKTNVVKELLTDFYIQHLDKEQIKKIKEELFDKYVSKLKKEQVKIQKSKKSELFDNPFTVKRFKRENNVMNVKEDVKKQLLAQYIEQLKTLKKNVSMRDTANPDVKRQQDKVKQYQKIQGNQELLDKKAEQLYNNYIKTESEQTQNQLQKNLSDQKWIARKKEQLFSKYLDSIDSQKLTKMFQDNISDEYVKEKRNEMGRIIFNRFTKEKTEESKTLTQIKNIFGNEIYKMVKAIEAEKNFKEKEFIRPLQMIITSVQREILDLVWAKLQLSGDDAVQRITKMIRASIAAVKKSDDSNLKKRLDYELEKLKQLTSATQDDEALKHLIPMEGVAFRYGNKQYKFTGLFAPINQLFGAIRWNDKLISELDEKDSKTEADVVADEVFNALAVENKAKLDPKDIEYFHYVIFNQEDLNFEEAKKSIVKGFEWRQQYKNPIRNKKQYEECIKKIQESETKEQLFKNSQQCEMLRVTQGKATPSREMSDTNKAIQSELSKQIIGSMCRFLMGEDKTFKNFADLINMIYDKTRSLEQKKNLITKIIHNRVDTRLTKLTNLKHAIEKITDKSKLDQIVIKYLSDIVIYDGGVRGVYYNNNLNNIKEFFNYMQEFIGYVADVVRSNENLDTKKKQILDFINYIYEKIEENYNKKYKDKIQIQQGTYEPRQTYIRKLEDTIKERNSEMDKMKIFIQHRILNATSEIELFDVMIIVCGDLIKYDLLVNKHIRLDFVRKCISQLLSNVINTPNLNDAKSAAMEYVDEIEGLNNNAVKSPAIKKILRGIQLAKDQFGLASYLYYMIFIYEGLGVHQRVEDDVSPMFSSAREQAKRLYHYRLKENEVLDLSNFAKEMKQVNEVIRKQSPSAMEKLSAVMNKDLDQRIKK